MDLNRIKYSLSVDMQIDKYGNDVGYEKRLEDIKNRYGEDSIQYTNSYKIIKAIV